jgi:hypothetical protein
VSNHISHYFTKNPYFSKQFNIALGCLLPKCRCANSLQFRTSSGICFGVFEILTAIDFWCQRVSVESYIPLFYEESLFFQAIQYCIGVSPPKVPPCWYPGVVDFKMDCNTTKTRLNHQWPNLSEKLMKQAFSKSPPHEFEGSPRHPAPERPAHYALSSQASSATRYS